MRSDLERQSTAFAGDLSRLLNTTVTNGIRLVAVAMDGNRSAIGLGITRTRLKSQPIPLTLGARPPTALLDLRFTVEMDPEGAYMATTKCSVGVLSADEQPLLLCRYDYVREPGNPYPSAHLQVGGRSEALDAIGARAGRPSASLPRLHLPVGGRRFRPAVEDVVEMLVVEGLAEGREGWSEAVARYRQAWHDRQLRAAVRRRPAPAAAQLGEEGYAVAPPLAG